VRPSEVEALKLKMKEADKTKKLAPFIDRESFREAKLNNRTICWNKLSEKNFVHLQQILIEFLATKIINKMEFLEIQSDIWRQIQRIIDKNNR